MENSLNACIIWLHGLGADGQDFAPIVQMLELPHIEFILPDAPYRPITINGGYRMRGWYDIIGLTLESPQDEHGIRETQNFLEHLIEGQIAEGIPTHRIALAGFSQGGAMALHTALRSSHRLAGVLALSTYLPLSGWLAQEKHAINQTIPIFMAHGIDDEVITLKTAERSLATLQNQGYKPEWHTYPMGHSVCENEIEDIRSFLLKILPETP